ncbi:MAG: hypothetical protein NVSMB3_11760 [Acidobacteriaceae bacterium]
MPGATLASVVAVVVPVMVVGKGLGRHGRDGKYGDSGEGKHEVAKVHKQQFLSAPEVSCCEVRCCLQTNVQKYEAG